MNWWRKRDGNMWGNVGELTSRSPWKKISPKTIQMFESFSWNEFQCLIMGEEFNDVNNKRKQVLRSWLLRLELPSLALHCCKVEVSLECDEGGSNQSKFNTQMFKIKMHHLRIFNQNSIDSSKLIQFEVRTIKLNMLTMSFAVIGYSFRSHRLVRLLSFKTVYWYS